MRAGPKLCRHRRNTRAEPHNVNLSKLMRAVHFKYQGNIIVSQYYREIEMSIFEIAAKKQIS
jgi:hypothetical protein